MGLLLTVKLLAQRGRYDFGYAGGTFGRSVGFFNVRPDASATGINPALYFATNDEVHMVITKTGDIGIGTDNPTEVLDVEGNIYAEGNFISGGTTLNVPDYVFEEDYNLRSLEEVGNFIAREKHLPDIPSAAEMGEKGVNMTELQMKLLAKVEELTLHTLQQEQTIKTLTARLDAMEQTPIAAQSQ